MIRMHLEYELRLIHLVWFRSSKTGKVVHENGHNQSVRYSIVLGGLGVTVRLFCCIILCPITMIILHISPEC